jgi:hypothetical protein
VLLNSSLLLGYFLLTNKKVPFFIISLYVLILITAFFLIFSPGILNRQSKFASGSLSAAVGIAVIKFFILHWFFIKEPLWWFFVFFTSNYLKINGSFFDKTFTSIRIPPTTTLLLYFTGGILIYIPVLYSTSGSLPLRSENIICYLYSLILLFATAIYISHKMLNAQSVLYRYRFLLLTILIFSSSNMKNITDSLLSGYFYSQVMTERLNLFEDAKQKNEDEVTFESYEEAVSKKIKDKFPIADRQVLKEIILKPPPIICFKSDLYDLNYMKEYYGIRKLNVEK